MKLAAGILYVAVLGLLSNPVARIFQHYISPQRFPFAPWGFEKGGKIYEKLGIRFWKDKLPDVSRVFTYMTPKKVRSAARPQLDALIQATIVAESVHSILIALSLGILTFWRNWGAGAFLAVYNLVGNVPFIMIQRYNRPRLLRLAERTGMGNG